MRACCQEQAGGEGAFEALCAWRKAAGEQRLESVLFMAIAMLRSDAAIDYLLDIVGHDTGEVAREAIASFTVHRHNPDIRARLEATVADRRDLDLRDAVEDLLG